MQASEPKDTNPYVAVVAKKHRNLRKKYASVLNCLDLVLKLTYCYDQVGEDCEG